MTPSTAQPKKKIPSNKWNLSHRVAFNEQVKDKNPLLVKFGNNLRKNRKNRGVFQKELVLQADLVRPCVGGLERGERSTVVLSLLRLCSPRGISLSTLVEG